MLTNLICTITLPGKAFTIFCIIIQVYTIMFSIILYKIIKSQNALNILHWTCEKGHIEDVKSVFKQNKKIFWNLDEHGHSALMIACIYGHDSIVQFLLNVKLPKLYFNQRNVYGYTPFILACQHGHLEVVKSLLSKDFIDFHQVDINGIPATLWACLRRQNTVIQFLEDNTVFAAEMSKFKNLVQEMRIKNEEDCNSKFIIWFNPEKGFEVKETEKKKLEFKMKVIYENS